MSVIIGGTIAIDNVKTPTAEANNLLGGSAPAEHLAMLESHGVDLTGVERSESESFTWTGEYMENMNDRETHAVALNVLEGWEVKVPATIADSNIVVLANMSPENQLQMLSQCQAEHRYVIADTMDLWISIANEPLHEVLQKIDMLVLNESEARQFAETPNLILAGEKLLAKGPKHVIIKLGEFGAVLFGPEGKMFRLHAWPLKEVADPTGAGDSFLGGMAGYLDNLDNDTYSFADISQAMARGSVAASFTCEAFSTLKLQEVTTEDLDSRLAGLREMSQW